MPPNPIGKQHPFISLLISYQNSFILQVKIKKGLKKTYIVILLAILVLGAAGFVYYKYWLNTEDVDIWTLVPDSAVAVYETERTVQSYNELLEKPIWGTLSSIDFFEAMEANMETLDSLAGKSGKLDEALRENPMLISAHITSKNSFDYIYYLEVNELEQHDLVHKISVSFKENPAFSSESHKYQDYVITEVKHRSSGSQFSYIFHRNYFIGSFIPFLVEDVIRHIEEEDMLPFKEANANLFTLPSLDDDEGNLYISSHKLPQFLTVFADGTSQQVSPELAFFCQQTYLDLSLQNTDILMNGFSLSPVNSSFYINTFRGQAPGSLGMGRFIPNRTALFYHYTFSDPVEWYKALQQFWQKRAPNQIEDQQKLQEGYALDIAGIYSWFGGELGLSVLESVDVNNPDLLLVIKAKDMNQALNDLNQLTEAANKPNNDSLYIESYAGLDIRQINIQEFPAKLLGNNFSGFEQTFYAPFENYLVMGSNIEVIKRLMADMESENTWGKSVRQHHFLEKTLQEANVAMIWNTARAWNMVNASLSPRWKGFAQKYSRQMKSFDLGALQFSASDDRFYTSFLLSNQPPLHANDNAQRFQTLTNAYTASPIVCPPFIVSNVDPHNPDVLLQDSLRHLYLISKEGKTLWRDSIEGKIISVVYQVDHFENGETQFFFATDTALHIIDRNGGYIDGYPLTMKEGVKLEQAAVIDYDNSKNYRFLLADEDGNIWMYDKAGENLEGWTPRALNHRLAVPPQHLRVRGRDFILALQENGVMNVLNRLGEMYPEFPLDFNKTIKSPFFVKPGGSFETTVITTITEDGELIKFNLNGIVLSREQLYKPSRFTRFKLVLDERQNTFIIARQELGRLSLLDRNGNEILEKDYITSDELAVQYFNYGAGKEIFAVTDKVQEFTYLYQKDGTLINGRPLESSFPIHLQYIENENTFQVHANYNDKYSITSFQTNF